ncbi:MAG: hypothetical protein AAF806_12890 [Bacteroidota bacterium]
MYKHILGLLLFSLSFSSSFAQSKADGLPGDIEWGEELKQPAGTILSKTIAYNKSGMYALRVKDITDEEKARVYIERYDNDLRLKKAQEIELKYKKKDRQFEDVIYHGGQLYLLTSFHNQAKKKNYLFKQKISNERLQINDRDIEKIGELDTRNILRDGGFDLVQSKDTSKLMVYHQLPYKKGEAENFKLRVFDESFSEIWSKDISLPYNNEIFSVEEYRVDNQGNVYLLGVLYRDKVRIRRNGSPNYQYVILTYTQDGSQANEYKIQLRDKFITDLTFRPDGRGNLVCSGFYSDRGTYSIKGTYFFRINTETKEIFNENTKAFDFEFLTEFLSENKKRKAKDAERSGDTRRQAELYRFSLDELILRSDGGALLIGEQYFVYEDFYRDPWTGFSRFDRYYHYNDIIIVNIRPTGEIEWATRIPKRQVTRNDGGYYSSYAMSIVRDKIYFVFNDNNRNFADTRNDRLYNFNGRNSIVSIVEVSKDGNWTITPLFPNREVDLITRPKVCKQVGRKKMLVYGEWGRLFRLAHLEFN